MQDDGPIGAMLRTCMVPVVCVDPAATIEVLRLGFSKCGWPGESLAVTVAMVGELPFTAAFSRELQIVGLPLVKLHVLIGWEDDVIPFERAQGDLLDRHYPVVGVGRLDVSPRYLTIPVKQAPFQLPRLGCGGCNRDGVHPLAFRRSEAFTRRTA